MSGSKRGSEGVWSNLKAAEGPLGCREVTSPRKLRHRHRKKQVGFGAESYELKLGRALLPGLFRAAGLARIWEDVPIGPK